AFAAGCSLACRTRHVSGGRLGGSLSGLVSLDGLRIRDRRRGRRSEAPAHRRRRSRRLDGLRDGLAISRRQARLPDAWRGLRREPWSWRRDPPTHLGSARAWDLEASLPRRTTKLPSA